jgi:asparagine synthase (glutamine-hydrolysing)
MAEGNYVGLGGVSPSLNKKYTLSPVPFGVLLSGGLDSSLISAIAARYVREQQEKDSKEAQNWWPKLHSFSIGLAGSPDLTAAREVSAQ